MPGSNALAYFVPASSWKKKKFYNIDAWPITSTCFTSTAVVAIDVVVADAVTAAVDNSVVVPAAADTADVVDVTPFSKLWVSML